MDPLPQANLTRLLDSECKWTHRIWNFRHWIWFLQGVLVLFKIIRCTYMTLYMCICVYIYMYNIIKLCIYIILNWQSVYVKHYVLQCFAICSGIPVSLRTSLKRRFGFDSQSTLKLGQRFTCNSKSALTCASKPILSWGWPPCLVRKHVLLPGW